MHSKKRRGDYFQSTFEFKDIAIYLEWQVWCEQAEYLGFAHFAKLSGAHDRGS
jgi:hypothetical protein